MYVAVKGGEKAIDAAHALQESRRRGDTDLPELSVAQIEQQLNLAVDRVMTEGGIADRELAALALKQASGDNVEAIFLLRAYRTTLAKLAVSEPLDTTEMRLERRISAVYKDIPGGQLLGPTYDYTHRLLDFTLLANGEAPTLTTADSEQQPSPHVFSLLARQGLVKFEEDSGAQPDDITRTPPVYPCSRSSRLQQLMRGDEGYLLALAYSTQRGYGRNHPFAGEIRSGYIDVSIVPEELGFAVNVGELLMTECEMVNGFIDPPDEQGCDDLFKHPGLLDFSHTVEPFVVFDLQGLQVTPLPLNHSKLTFGYLLETAHSRVAWLSDTAGLPEKTLKFLLNNHPQVMVIDCSHPPRADAPRNHCDLNTVLALNQVIRSPQVILTHISHQFDAWLMENALPSGFEVGFDGMEIGVA
ncbi:hypothetical protein GJQ31_002306 [Escherichia coli]|nr:hypothetical protein [Escherichia coli]